MMILPVGGISEGVPSPCVLLMAKPPCCPPPRGSSPCDEISRVARKAGVSTRSVVHGLRNPGTGWRVALINHKGIEL